MSLAFKALELNDTARIGLANPSGAGSGSALLRWSLRLTDFAALVVAWQVALTTLNGTESSLSNLADTVAIALVAIVLIHFQGLYLARVATMRTVEHMLLVRASAMLLAVGTALHLTGVLHVELGARVFGSIASFVTLLVGRTVYRAWLSGARASGQFTQPIVMVGIDQGSVELRTILEEQPELGYTIVGAVGSRERAIQVGMSDLWLGEIADVSQIVRRKAATGAIVSTTALEPDDVNAVTRSLLSQRCHVHLNTGISGVDQRRLRSVHLGYEPLLYVEPMGVTPFQQRMKRLLDVVIAATMTVITAPIVLASVIAIKLEDGGPVLFRQERVGLDGNSFDVFKLRTMSVDAEAGLDALLDLNERNGPLFKLQFDPRVTRVGRILRSLSIDELPQLWNVLRGEMSMVGPRPALPERGRRASTTACVSGRASCRASPACGRSRPGTTRRSTPTSASTCSTSTTGPSGSTS